MTEIENFFQHYTPIAFKKGEIILEADNEPTGILFLKSGLVRQFTITKEGIELTLHFFKPGSYFPLSWAINNEPNKYFYQAQTRVDAVLAPKGKMLEFLETHPKDLFNLTSRLLFALTGLLTRIEYLAKGTAETRVDDTVTYLQKHFGPDLEGLTHQDIANFASLSRETVSRQLEKKKTAH